MMVSSVKAGALVGFGFWLGLLVACNSYDLAVRLRRRGI